ncbi:MAG: PrsW family glutamic-type intramembrane protease, partial [Nitrospiraceae bacterium]
WGYALGKAKFAESLSPRGMILKAFFLAVVCHGLFNFFAFFPPEGFVGEVVLLAVMWKMVLRSIAEGLKTSPHRALSNQ